MNLSVDDQLSSNKTTTKFTIAKDDGTITTTKDLNWPVDTFESSLEPSFEQIIDNLIDYVDDNLGNLDSDNLDCYVIDELTTVDDGNWFCANAITETTTDPFQTSPTTVSPNRGGNIWYVYLMYIFVCYV